MTPQMSKQDKKERMKHHRNTDDVVSLSHHNCMNNVMGYYTQYTKSSAPVCIFYNINSL